MKGLLVVATLLLQLIICHFLTKHLLSHHLLNCLFPILHGFHYITLRLREIN